MIEDRVLRSLVFFCLVIFSINPAHAQERRYSFEKGMMGSPFKLVFYASSDSIAEVAARHAYHRVEVLNEMMSDYRDGSEINRLSATAGSGQWIPVSKELFEILEVSNDVSAKTDGVFDATLGPVVQMWRRATRKSTLPGRAEIDSALSKTGYRKMELDPVGQKVLLKQKGMRLDIGGLGKGFAAEEAIQVLRGYGITSAMMDAGGKIVLTNPPPGSEGWQINISNGHDSLETLTLSNVSLATSGPTYRYMEHQGVRYSHIVDPKTGIGLLFHVRTTVIAPNGTISDALATAFSVAGIKKSKSYARRFPGCSVWLVEQRGGKTVQWNSINRNRK